MIITTPLIIHKEIRLLTPPCINRITARSPIKRNMRWPSHRFICIRSSRVAGGMCIMRRRDISRQIIALASSLPRRPGDDGPLRASRRHRAVFRFVSHPTVAIANVTRILPFRRCCCASSVPVNLHTFSVYNPQAPWSSYFTEKYLSCYLCSN